MGNRSILFFAFFKGVATGNGKKFPGTVKVKSRDRGGISRQLLDALLVLAVPH